MEEKTLSVRFTGTVDGDVLTGRAFETMSVMGDGESHEAAIPAELTSMR